MTTRPSTASPDSLSLSANQPASSTVSDRGEVTSTKAVVGRASSRRMCSARVRKPSSMPSKAWKKATASWTISAPATLEMVRSSAWVATETARR